jgi:hypothetical protein
MTKLVSSQKARDDEEQTNTNIDPELLDSTYNEVRRPSLPYRDRKNKIWSLHESIAGFISPTEGQLPALTASSQSEVELLPPDSQTKTNLRRISSEQIENDYDELEDEEYDELGAIDDINF